MQTSLQQYQATIPYMEWTLVIQTYLNACHSLLHSPSAKCACVTFTYSTERAALIGIGSVPAASMLAVHLPRTCGTLSSPQAPCASGHIRPSRVAMRLNRPYASSHITPRVRPALFQSTGVDQSEAYNQEMKKAMGWDDADPYQYHYDRGLYYHEVMPNLLCGSQPRNVEDIVKLKEDIGASVIINLQQDKDFEHWGVDFGAVSSKAQQLGIHLIRRPAQDFDPHSLRHTLPAAVHSVHHALKDNQRVYVHCTAGLGRAPAVCIAYMFWFKDMGLDEAYKHLTDKRPCGPKRDAIRGATFDLCSGRPPYEFDGLDSNAFTGMSQHEKDTLRHRVTTWAG